MKTVISTDIDLAAGFLRAESVIGMPTETVYGLAGNAFSPKAVASIFAIKQRPAFNPLILHVPGIDALDDVVTDVPVMAAELMQVFWPGPLTLLLPKQAAVPDTITAGKPTVAVRVPAHPMALALLRTAGFPLVAPSANPFGSISPTRAIHVAEYFDGQIPLVLDGGECPRGVESTIVGFPDGEPVVYRLGAISLEAIESITGPVRVLKTAEAVPDAPGMLLRHYAPRTPLILTSDAAAEARKHVGRKMGILSFTTQVDVASAAHMEVLSPAGSDAEAAAALYDTLHRLDRLGLDLIIAQRFPDEGLGRTINDRLERGARP
jgi:L-threonylcarbamoyladenylate synthase